MYQIATAINVRKADRREISQGTIVDAQNRLKSVKNVNFLSKA
jgi:hypothetical protein